MGEPPYTEHDKRMVFLDQGGKNMASQSFVICRKLAFPLGIIKQFLMDVKSSNKDKA